MAQGCRPQAPPPGRGACSAARRLRAPRSTRPTCPDTRRRRRNPAREQRHPDAALDAETGQAADRPERTLGATSRSSCSASTPNRTSRGARAVRRPHGLHVPTAPVERAGRGRGTAQRGTARGGGPDEDVARRRQPVGLVGCRVQGASRRFGRPGLAALGGRGREPRLHGLHARRPFGAVLGGPSGVVRLPLKRPRRRRRGIPRSGPGPERRPSPRRALLLGTGARRECHARGGREMRTTWSGASRSPRSRRRSLPFPSASTLRSHVPP